MMSQSIKRKCVFSGCKVNVKTEIIVHFYMKILKKNYLYANILKKQVNALKVNNASIDIILPSLKIQMETHITKIMQMDNFQVMKHALITKEDFVIKEMDVNL